MEQVLSARAVVFKGGTCLSKVHADFFRLSEDLDFAVSVKHITLRMGTDGVAWPGQSKLHLAERRGATCPIFSEAVALTGQNINKQYNGQLAYRSVVTGDTESIRIEISLREEFLLPCASLDARTLLIDSLTRTPALAPVSVLAISLKEAYAEKTRAALTRRDPAIRDFFDLDNAIPERAKSSTVPGFWSSSLRSSRSRTTPSISHLLGRRRLPDRSRLNSSRCFGPRTTRNLSSTG